jgi:hypothetical protein
MFQNSPVKLAHLKRVPSAATQHIGKRSEMRAKFLSKDLRYPLAALAVDERIMLKKLILRKQTVRVWAGFIRQALVVGSNCESSETSRSIKS